MENNEFFELLAEVFRLDTGMLAPGKDDPVGDVSHEMRRITWNRWCRKHATRSGYWRQALNALSQSSQSSHQNAE